MKIHITAEFKFGDPHYEGFRKINFSIGKTNYFRKIWLKK